MRWHWVLYIAVLALVSGIVWKRTDLLRPRHNWDMLGYIGSAVASDTTDPIAIHGQTYAALRSALEESELGELLTGTYRGDVAANPYHFAQQIPFYSVKPLYVLGVRLFRGVGLVKATMAVSLLSWLGIAIIVFLWTHRLWVSLLLIFCPPIFELARLSTPDGLSTLLLLAGMFLVLERKRTTLGAGLWVLVVWARADSVIVACFLLFWLLLSKKIGRADGAVLLLLTLASFLVVAHFGYGRDTLLYHSLVKRQVAPAEFVAPLSSYFQLKNLVQESVPLVTRSYALVFLLLSAVKGFRFPWLLLVLLLAYMLRYVAFPSWEERFLAFPYLMLALTSFSSPRFPHKESDTRARKGVMESTPEV